MKILCFGSLNIDYTYKVEHFVQKGETISSQSLQVFSGGKGLNQSIALAKAGAEVYHAGAVGTDGGFLLRQLEEAGVNTEHVAVLDEVRTGNAIIQNDKDGDNCIILYGGANQAITREQADQVLKSFDKGDYLLLQNEINELPYIMEKAHRKGMNVILNPSPMDEKMKELPLDDVDYFLLNEVEAGQILDTGETDGEILAERLLERFPGASIVLTLGSKGSIYADGNKRYIRRRTVSGRWTRRQPIRISIYFIAEAAAGQTPEKSHGSGGTGICHRSYAGGSRSVDSLEKKKWKCGGRKCRLDKKGRNG